MNKWKRQAKNWKRLNNDLEHELSMYDGVPDVVCGPERTHPRVLTSDANSLVKPLELYASDYFGIGGLQEVLGEWLMGKRDRRRKCADLVRARIPLEVIQQAWRQAMEEKASGLVEGE